MCCAMLVAGSWKTACESRPPALSMSRPGSWAISGAALRWSSGWGYAALVGVRATVRNGRLVVDEEIALPEGTVVNLVIDDEGDELDERERQALNAAIDTSLEQEARGEVNPAEKILARLRERRR
ncbi:hypothetical protein ENSA5_21010 [Enhygromyxa salina]|uniref:Uncharacterized protein n=1 Tax=Enhygromyxa salina TaxID=215803 RepID=A0A2S9YCC0_9BACT|nr:hypothetical protein [Enhygromyxa salina]PRQ02749.1 hypothetical protein ENSA5_21010 [Enhygromyxa salina]